MDPGRVRVGVAVSDETRTIAQPHCTLERQGRGAGLDRLLGLVRELEATEIVVGLPLDLDGGEGPAAAAARRLGERLRTLSGLPVAYADERLSSKQAERQLLAAGMRRGRRRQLGDQVAAALILQQVLVARGGRPG
ncbi:MAG: Holliday junction resolvase RuvX [Candidatus Dormibacteria bacterium]